jgi:glycosyltransferase involved in cell wall biosynthesis
MNGLEGIVSGEEVGLINRGLNTEKPTISLCMIVKDVAENLIDCLEPIKNMVDEIIIVDTGSKDNTKEIAKRYTDKVYDFEIPKVEYKGELIDDVDFSAIRNYADSLATGDWILTLDADERIKPEYVNLLKNLIAQNPEIVAYEFTMFNYSNNNTYSCHRRFKAYKNKIGIHYSGKIHETIGDSVKGKTALAPIPVVHLGYVNREKNLEKAYERNIPILEREVEKDPTNYFYLYYLGKSYMGMGDKDKGKKYLEESLKYSAHNIGVNLETKFYLGNLAIQEGDYQKGLKYYQDVIKEDPYFPDVHFIVGVIFMDRKQYDIALNFLEWAWENRNTNKNKINMIKIYFTDKKLLELLQLVSSKCKSFDKTVNYLLEELNG